MTEGHAALRWSAPGTWLRLAGLAAAYYGAAQLGLAFALSAEVASPVWPPTGLAVAAVAMWGLRAVPAVAVAAVAVEWQVGIPFPWALLVGLGASAEAAIGGSLLRRWGGPTLLRRLSGISRHAAIAGLAPIPAAAAGLAALLGSGIVQPAGAAWVGLTWYLGNVAGCILVVPAVILAWEALRRRLPTPLPRRLAEGAGVAALLAATTYAVFWLGSPLAYLYVVPLVWLALRFGPTPTAFGLLALEAAAVVATRAGLGPFAAATPDRSLLLLQGFVVGLGLLCLSVAALSTERARAAAGLEERVRERTRQLQEAVEGLRHEAQERELAQAQLEEAQHVASMGTWRWDLSQPHAEWSPELYRIYGLDPATHVPSYEDYLRRVHPDDVERVRAATTAVLQDARPYSHDERVRRPDGSWRTLHTWSKPILDARGKVVALVGACQDITERLEAEARSRDMQRLQEQAEFKTNFLRTAAHELGTPLTPILLQMRLLRSLLEAKRLETEGRALDILDRNIRRLRMLVQDLLESARLQSGRLKLDARQTDLAELVHEVTETFAGPAAEAGIRLESDAPERVPVVADPDRLAQVLYNLLSNATKFTPAGKAIRVRLATRGDEVELSVQDEGAGFDPHRAPALFQPFSQIHDTMQSTRGGSGLGLYISRGIVEQHGGRIVAHSAGPGQGATFICVLPRIARLPDPEAPPAAVFLAHSGSPIEAA